MNLRKTLLVLLIASMPNALYEYVWEPNIFVEGIAEFVWDSSSKMTNSKHIHAERPIGLSQ